MMTTRQVADALGCSTEMVRQYAINGYLESHTNSGTIGRAQRRYFDPGEVEAFRTGGAIKAAAYRESKKLPARRARHKV